MKKVLLFLTIVICLLSSIAPTAMAKHLYLEHYYQQLLATALHGTMEYRLDDNSRVDILTKEYAIETDFTSKVYESFGQARYYAIKTGKIPGVQLVEIGDAARDNDAIHKLRILIKDYNKPFRLWIYNAEGTCIVDEER